MLRRVLINDYTRGSLPAQRFVAKRSSGGGSPKGGAQPIPRLKRQRSEISKSDPKHLKMSTISTNPEFVQLYQILWVKPHTLLTEILF